MNRRSFMQSILLAAAAPAIVRADSLMKFIPRSGGFTETMLEQAMIEMMCATDERGLLIYLPPTHLIIPSVFEPAARRILSTAPVEMTIITKPILHDEWFLASNVHAKDHLIRLTKEPVARINGDFNRAPVEVKL